MACRSSQLSCTSARAMASGQKSSCEASEALPAPAVSWRDSTASLLDAMMMMRCQNNCACGPRELLLLRPRQQQMCCSHHHFLTTVAAKVSSSSIATIESATATARQDGEALLCKLLH